MVRVVLEGEGSGGRLAYFSVNRWSRSFVDEFLLMMTIFGLANNLLRRGTNLVKAVTGCDKMTT